MKRLSNIPSKARNKTYLRLFFPSTNRGLQFTRVGLWFTIITTLLGVGALNTGINTLFIAVGIFLSAIILSGWISERIMRNLALKIEPAGIMIAGEPIVMKAEVRNKHAGLPIIGLNLKIPEWEISKLVPFIPRSETQIVWLTGKSGTRGKYERFSVECRTQFPFGLFEKFQFQTCSLQLYIAPKQVKLPEQALRQIGEHESPEHDTLGNDEFYQLKNYQPGDPVHHIHWKKTSTSTEVILNEYMQPINHGIYRFYCDPRLAQTADGYELFLSKVFSLIIKLHENQDLFYFWIPDGECLKEYEAIAIWLAELPSFEMKNSILDKDFIPQSGASILHLYEYLEHY